MLLRKKQREVRNQIMMRKIELDMINGHLDQKDLAVKYGVSIATISRNMTRIRDRWRLNDMEDLDMERQHRIMQFEQTRQEAYKAWRKSMESREEITLQTEVCGRCYGNKHVITKEGNVIDCPRCDASGKTTIETLKTVGQCGDSSYLNVMQRATNEICKLRGLYPERKVNRTTVDVNLNEGTVRIEQTVYDNMTSDDLIETLQQLEAIKVRAKERRLTHQESDVIEAEVVHKTTTENQGVGV